MSILHCLGNDVEDVEFEGPRKLQRDMESEHITAIDCSPSEVIAHLYVCRVSYTLVMSIEFKGQC